MLYKLKYKAQIKGKYVFAHFTFEINCGLGFEYIPSQDLLFHGLQINDIQLYCLTP